MNERSKKEGWGMRTGHWMAFGLWAILLGASCAGERTLSVTASGVVDGDVISVKGQVGGTLQDLHIVEGMEVAEDSVIAEVDSRKTRNSLDGLDIAEREIVISQSRLRHQAALFAECPGRNLKMSQNSRHCHIRTGTWEARLLLIQLH